MNNQEAPGASKKVDPLHDGSPAVFDPYGPTDHTDHRQDRPPAVVFDPYFGKLPRDSRNFDTVTWGRVRYAPPGTCLLRAGFPLRERTHGGDPHRVEGRGPVHAL